MLSIEQCIKILNKNGDIKFTNDEVKAIREFLYYMANLQIKLNK